MSLEDQIFATWRRHNEILLLLLEAVPDEGLIALALKQSGMRLPEEVAVEGLWGRWISGR